MSEKATIEPVEQSEVASLYTISFENDNHSQFDTPGAIAGGGRGWGWSFYHSWDKKAHSEKCHP